MVQADAYLKATTALVSAAFALIVWASGRRRAENWFLSLFFLLIAGNQGAETLRRLDPADATLWFGLANVFAALDPVALYYFASIYPERNRLNRPPFVIGVMTLGALFAFASWTVEHPDLPSGRNSVLAAGMTLYTAVVYTVVLVAVLDDFVKDPARPRLRLLYAALALAAVPVWTRVLTHVAFAWMAFGGKTLGEALYGFLAMVSPVLVVAWLIRRARRRTTQRAEARRFVTRMTVAGLALAFILMPYDFYIALFGWEAQVLPWLLVASHSSASVRWLLFGSLVSMAVLRYEMLGMSLQSRRRAARVLVGLGFLLVGALVLSVVRTLIDGRDLTFSAIDAMVLGLVLVASQGFRRVIDRVATAVYGVPMPGDSVASFEAYRLAAADAAKRGSSAQAELHRLREELGIDARTGDVLERMARASSEGSLAPGQVVAGRYRVQRMLGRGGSGRVFLARDELLLRDVVLKEIQHADDEGRMQALREAQAAGQLQHPQVVTLYDVHQRLDSSLLVTEYVPNGSLAERLQRSGLLSEGDGVKLLDDVLEGLAAVHARGIVHRDLKPANVLLTREGRAKIGDFGIAWIRQSMTSHAGSLAAFQGTPDHMAPEQRRGEAPTAATDLYAVGLLARKGLRGPLSQRIERIVGRALAEDPRSRWRSAEEMREALREAAAPVRHETSVGSGPRR